MTSDFFVNMAESGIFGIDEYTYVMLHCDVNPSGNTIFLDSSLSPLTITSEGNVYQDTAQYKFGGASAKFDGSGDALTFTTPNISSSAFCADMCVRFSTMGTIKTFFSIGSSLSTTTTGFALNTRANNHLAISSGDAVAAEGSTVLSADTWYHIAMVGNGGSSGSRNYKVYIDGTLEMTYTTNYSLNSTVRFGKNGTSSINGMNGWMDELRLSVGVQRWTTNFTPPTDEYST